MKRTKWLLPLGLGVLAVLLNAHNLAQLQPCGHFTLWLWAIVGITLGTAGAVFSVISIFFYENKRYHD